MSVFIGVWSWMLTACEQSAWHKEQRGYKILNYIFYNICVSVFLLSCHNLTVNIAQFIKHSHFQTQFQRYIFRKYFDSPCYIAGHPKLATVFINILINGSPSIYQRLWHCSWSGHWINRVVSSFVCPNMEMWNVVGSFQSFIWLAYL